ncbi:MAG: SOS response-associated peptidase family protein, partial [Pseudomonadota bacterium]|nr:SOS response-associated peptidase family protein [Pseudomonadota bacterium]
QKQHCVVPVSGFYEWYRSDNGKQPFLVNDQAQKGLLLAGIWDAWRPKGGAGAAAELLSFSLLTAAAHENLLELHHRQPIFLTIEQALDWLDPSNATEPMAADLASTLPVPLQMTPVSREVNNVRNKSARCAQALAPSYEVSANISFKAADLSTMEEAKPVEQESFIADS